MNEQKEVSLALIEAGVDVKHVAHKRQISCAYAAASIADNKLLGKILEKGGKLGLPNIIGTTLHIQPHKLVI